jgi:RNA polymerase sigma factor (sigma-70 family)
VTERDIAEEIRRAPASNQAASDSLYRLLRSKFLPFLSQGTSPENGEDLLHELYMLVRASIVADRIEDLDALSAYARGVARKLRTRAIQKQALRMRKVIPIDQVDAYRKRPRHDPEDEAITREEASELAGVFQAMLAGLDPLDRSLIERFYFRGQGAERIQADLGLGPGQFRLRMQRLRQRLKDDYERIQRLAPNGPQAA